MRHTIKHIIVVGAVVRRVVFVRFIAARELLIPIAQDLYRDIGWSQITGCVLLECEAGTSKSGSRTQHEHRAQPLKEALRLIPTNLPAELALAK